MEWYIVIKTINGHRYRYRQKTWREGDRVRTRSEYIGPADGTEPTPRTPKDVVPRPPVPGRGHVVVEESLQALLGGCSTDWVHAWKANRHGPSLIKKDARIETMLRTLKAKRTYSTQGAFYDTGRDVVNIPPARCFESTERQSATQAYYMVLFHELVHWTLHKSRLSRKAGIFGDAYAQEELVAELGAVVLMRHFGLEVGDTARHAKYFQIWLDRTADSERALRYAEEEADRAVRYITSGGTIRT